MAYQVGGTCFTTLQSAALAACYDVQPVVLTKTDGNTVYTSCTGVGGAGALYITRVTQPAGTIDTKAFNISFPDCNQVDYVDASIQIFVALAIAWASVYGLWWLYKRFDHYLTWSRADD